VAEATGKGQRKIVYQKKLTLFACSSEGVLSGTSKKGENVLGGVVQAEEGRAGKIACKMVYCSECR